MFKKRATKIALTGTVIGAALSVGLVMPAHADGGFQTGYATLAICNQERLAYQRAGYQTQTCQQSTAAGVTRWGFFYTGNGSRAVDLTS